MLALNTRQIEKFSDLLMDLAKGLFLAAFTIQILTGTDLISFLKYSGTGIIFAYLSLRILERNK